MFHFCHPATGIVVHGYKCADYPAGVIGQLLSVADQITGRIVQGNHNHLRIPDFFTLEGTIQRNLFYRKGGNAILPEQVIEFRPLLRFNGLFRQPMQLPCSFIKTDKCAVFITNDSFNARMRFVKKES